mgnify:CR=1 FL=1|jgi:hypothetical protein
MATVTLGNIKFNWKGAYNSSTAYVVDDVVSLSGSSYVCIQAGTNKNPASQSAYWEQMSSAGTDGTDVGTTITTQGDLLYRDGSGLQRLAKGTAGQVLQMNSGATAPEWAAAAGIVSSGTFADGRNFGTYSWDNQTSSTSTSFIDVTGSEWNVGAGALTANKTCVIQYSVISHNLDWQHDKIALQYSVDDGSNWLYTNNNSEDVFDVDHELSSGANATTRRTAFHIISFTSGQTPRFRMKCAIYSSSNGLKINYDAGNNGTVKSYYQAWFV